MISLGPRVEATGMEAQSMSQESARESLVSKQPQTVTTSAAESLGEAAAVEAAAVPGTSKRPRVEDVTGSWQDNVESGAMPSSQDVLNLIASTYFKKLDPSTTEEFNEFIQYMEQVRKVVIVDVKTGSLEVIVQCSSLKVLEELWKDYSTGHLNEIAQKFLVTERILKAFGLAEVKLTTTIKEEEYRACRRLLSKPDRERRRPGQRSERARSPGMTEVKDGVVADDDLKGLSLQLGSPWKSLALRLKFSRAEIEGFDHDEKELAEKSFRMLCRWKEKSGLSGATYKVLYEALCHKYVDRKDLAGQFCNA